MTDPNRPLSALIAELTDVANWIDRTKPQGLLYDSVRPSMREAVPLLKELERLRGALRKIAWLRPAGPSRGGLVEQMERIALAALETTHD